MLSGVHAGEHSAKNIMRTLLRASFVFAVLALLPLSYVAQSDVTGPAMVVDGDTIIVAGGVTDARAKRNAVLSGSLRHLRHDLTRAFVTTARRQLRVNTRVPNVLVPKPVLYVAKIAGLL